MGVFIIYAPKRHKPRNTWQIELVKCLVTCEHNISLDAPRKTYGYVLRT